MSKMSWQRRGAALVAAVGVLLAGLSAPSAVSAATPPTLDAFYNYTGSTPLADIAPGTVLKTRSLPYHLVGLSLPLTATQLLFRSTGALGQPTVSVTSVLRAPGKFDSTKALSYQSFYDSLNPADEPSYAISGGLTLGGIIPQVELAVFGAFVLQGYSIIIPDTQGEAADFAAAPEYGMVTLDSIRAASNSPATGLTKSTKIGLLGYSGGAIATGWASALAPSYAPDVNSRLIGAAEGGVFVDPVHNLHYISGSTVWAGVLVMAIIGIARAFQIDLTPYMSAYGLTLFTKLQKASIATVLGEYPGLTWQKIAKPQYAQPESIPVLVRVVNLLNLGSQPSPTVPMFIGQGANGVIEGTSGNKAGIGPGDGVMVAGDVRTLARQYCSSGTRVEYTQYDALSHVTSVALWLPAAITWLDQRFAGVAAPQNCASIKPGNSLAPIPAP
ncbi:lipase family protein [Jatrophihabitans sp.]|uniref:lipase family protein n=1 Tax=Jatrophihabitans sp. TaxID=1932789 RepID=UPI0030C66C53|nr:secretory lipase family protein [Jatrophihabitans sp.]